ncbi:MAG: hypothetical protein ZNDK_1209 [Candidatus Desulfovibrio kirbyi]|uniref:Uncharacterized protein n=1 Tax=Candidatus Desulfovibrio kirbyi TaxID=2696086 RepID=A0A6L2R770_9BACT|nr:MAG: hypothetical protein ZNDK_1209 [Candidatus Desulfovibrio kirbyi]
MDTGTFRHNVMIEQKAQELIKLAFVLCEKHIIDAHGQPSPTHTSLVASALALQKAIETFLAVERICD